MKRGERTLLGGACRSSYTTLAGLRGGAFVFPRVARGAQPRALLRNTVGVGEESRLWRGIGGSIAVPFLAL